MDNPYRDIEEEAMYSNKTVDEILASKKIIIIPSKNLMTSDDIIKIGTKILNTIMRHK